jgi:putative ABC transport system permease protein
MAARVRQLAASLEHAAVIPLWTAIQPGEAPQLVGDTRVLPTIDLARKTGTNSYRSESRLYVATPALLRHLGIDPAAVDPSTDFLADPTVPTDELVIPNTHLIPGMQKKRGKDFAVTNVQRINSRELLGAPSRETLAPSSFITLNGLRRHGWRQIPAGWLVESDRPLTSKQIAAARDLAANAGLTIEAQRASTSYAKPIAIATAAGALLALAILAMTVGLIRSESAGDLRTLTATGATSRIRRTLTAATAGALALLGALLGIAGAYLALAATYFNDLGYLSRVPVLPLVLIVVGVPITATAAGWLLAGREPPTITRPAIA